MQATVAHTPGPRGTGLDTDRMFSRLGAAAAVTGMLAWVIGVALIPPDAKLEKGSQQLARVLKTLGFDRYYVRGEGCYLYDDRGEKYLDFLAGISVLNVGHCHPTVVQAVRGQVGRLTHATNLYYTEPGLRLCEALSRSSLS